MQTKITMWCSVAVLSGGLLSAQGGDLNPPSPDPDNPAGAMYTLEDLYQRLLNGVAGVLRGVGFVEPTGGPSSTGHTLNDLMSIAPAEDNTDGALPSEVLDGKTYWSLRTDGTWGPQTGSLSTQMIDNSTVNQAAGNYAEFDLSNPADGGDSDLIASNLAEGVDIFGIIGTALVAVGDAVADQVLAGATFSTAAGVNLTGTMPNIGQQNITPSTVDQVISQGFHDGTGQVAGDADLVSGNIASGVDIFGVAGAALIAAGNAVANQVLAGATFSTAAGVNLTGTMPDSTTNITPGTVAQAIPQGFHDGTGQVAGDEDLLAVNIASGTEIFGVIGTAEVRGVPCPCFGVNLARAVIRELQPGITPQVESAEFCISQPGIFGSIHAGFSDASPLNQNFGAIQSTVFQSGGFKCQIFWRHFNLSRSFTFDVTADEVASCRAVMVDAIALEDTNNRCNINHIP